MRLFRKDRTDYQLTNEDWQKLGAMFYRYINKDLPVTQFVSMSDYISKAFAYNPTIYSIIMWRATGAKGIPWLVYRIKNKQKFRQYQGLTMKQLNLNQAITLKDESLEEITGTPINKLLEKPNPLYTFQDIIEEMFVYRDVTGNSYLYGLTNPVKKEIIQLFSLPGDKTKIIAGDFLDPVQGYSFDQIQDGKMLVRDQIAHWKYMNPFFDQHGRQLYGMSPLVAAARLINNDNMAIDSMNSAFLNEGVKTIITGTDQTDIAFTPEQGELLRKKFERHMKLAKEGKGNIAFNRAPLAAVKIGESPMDLGVMEARKFNKEVLCNLFRLHPSLLSSDASTLNNLTEARKALMTMSVLPDMDGLRDHINALIQRFHGTEYFVDYDIMAISELQDDIEKLGRTLATMDFITINEKREMTNYDRFENPAADQLYQSMGNLPLGYNLDSGFDDIDENLDKIKQNGELVRNK